MRRITIYVQENFVHFALKQTMKRTSVTAITITNGYVLSVKESVSAPGAYDRIL